MTSVAQDIRIDRVEGSVMPVNSYLVHGPDGLVVVDGQLTVSDARAVRAAIEETGAPVAAMVLTHGHPDHYAGAATVLEATDAPIIATTGVDEVIRRDDTEKDQIVGPMMGDEWPSQRRFPDRTVDAGQTISVGGLDLRVEDLGPAESHDDTMWSLDDDTAFIADVASNDMHAYLADGHFRSWTSLLERLHERFSDHAVLYPGHGAPTDRSILAWQRRYVEEFVEAVAATLELDETKRREEVVGRMRDHVPHDTLLFLLELSIEPVRAILADEAG